MAAFVFDVRDGKKVTSSVPKTSKNDRNRVFPASLSTILPIPDSILWKRWLLALEYVAACPWLH